MMEVLSHANLMLLALCAPWVAAFLIPLFHRAPQLRETVTLIVAVALAYAVWSIYFIVADDPNVLKQGVFDFVGFQVVPGLEFAFKIEPLGLLFALVASSLWIVNSVYSIGYMRANDEPRQTQYYMCFAIALGSTIGLAFAKNLFTLFLFYEILTFSTYPLVTHKGTPEAVKAGRVYLMLLVGTSMVLFLPAILITYAYAGALDFIPGGILDGRLSVLAMSVLLALYIFGIGKAALVPVHFWLPAAMVAPTPVSALLHAVAVVKAGVFTVLKVIVYIFGIDVLAKSGAADWLVWAAGATILLASIVALRQDNLKKRLAFSTVSQLSYVVLGAAILAPLSVIGAAAHIATHAVAKITLFFAAGSIYTAAHKTEISQLDGIGWKMPWTMGAFAVGALAMIGLPPTSGFVSKWFILSGAMETQQWVGVVVIVLSTLLNAAYFVPILIRAFFITPDRVSAGSYVGALRNSTEEVEDHGEAPWPIVLALTTTAVMTILLFLLPDVVLDLAKLMLAR